MASSSKHVERLSATKQRQSLGQIKQAEKDKANASAATGTRKTIRTTVVNPNELGWPHVSEEDEMELKNCLQSDLQCLKFPNYHIPLQEIKKIEKSERRKFRNIWCTRKSLEVGFDVANYTKLRADLAFGVNCVSTAMEQDLLIGLIIEKDVDPPLLTKLLVPIATAKGVPIVAISGLKDTCRQIFKTRCIAMGLKGRCNEIGHSFHRIFQLITSISRKSDSDELEDTIELASCSTSEIQVTDFVCKTPSSSDAETANSGGTAKPGSNTTVQKRQSQHIEGTESLGTGVYKSPKIRKL